MEDTGRILRIGKADIPESHRPAFPGAALRQRPVLQAGGCVKDFLQTVRGHQAAGQCLKDHGQHHHSVQDLGNIGNCRHDGAGCGLSGLHPDGTDVDDPDHREIQDDVHHRTQKREHHLHIKLDVGKLPVCFPEARFLRILLHKGLDHPDTGHVFLHDAVQPVQARLQKAEQRIRLPHDEDDVDEDQRKGAGRDHAEGQVQGKKGCRAAEEEHAAAHQTADHLHDQLLDLGHVVRDPGDQGAGGEIIHLAEGKMHDVPETVFPDIVPQVLSGHIGEDCGQEAEKTAQRHDKDHPGAGGDHKPGIRDTAPVQAQDPPVHDDLHQPRLQEIHEDLSYHECRGEECQKPVFFHVTQDSSHAAVLPLTSGRIFFHKETHPFQDASLEM